jgi:hypothetical protein
MKYLIEMIAKLQSHGSNSGPLLWYNVLMVRLAKEFSKTNMILIFFFLKTNHILLSFFKN